MRPDQALALAALAATGLVLLWDEAPVVGNHWLLVGFVNLAILAALAWAAANRQREDPTETDGPTPFERALFPTARLCLLGFYAFAAFAKLNSGFFDPAVSCGPYYFRESMGSVGLESLAFEGSRLVDWLVIVGPTLIELAVPVMLIVPRTRHAGVVVALVFHGVLAIDRDHQFYDFSSMLAALFVLFLPRSFARHVLDRLADMRARILEGVRPGLLGAIGTALLVVALAMMAFDRINDDAARDIGWFLWQPYMLGVIALVVGFLRAERPAPSSSTFVPAHAALALIPVLVVLNGFTPYLEVKSAAGWNMYANLRLVDGESNHFIVRRSFPLTGHHADLVRIVDTDHPGLQWYIDGDYALTFDQFRAFVSKYPDMAITYERRGSEVSLARASDDPDLVRPLPVWQEKFQVFRAVDLSDPERCTPLWGPAR